jgi:hypothetical protein
MSAEPEYGDALIFAGRILHDLIAFSRLFCPRSGEAAGPSLFPAIKNAGWAGLW